jgi:hypothetical protein
MSNLDRLDPLNYTYTIDETDNFAVRMWFGSTDEEPFVYQPCWPDHKFQWASKQEAETWATAKIAELTDENARTAPNYPGHEGEIKLPSDEVLKQSVSAKLAAIGITTEELIVLLNGGIGGLK